MDFERMIESMEKSSENNVISLLDAKQLFSDVNHNTLAQIYDYWLNKRLSLVRVLFIQLLLFNKHCLKLREQFLIWRLDFGHLIQNFAANVAAMRIKLIANILSTTFKNNNMVTRF